MKGKSNVELAEDFANAKAVLEEHLDIDDPENIKAKRALELIIRFYKERHHDQP